MGTVAFKEDNNSPKSLAGKPGGNWGRRAHFNVEGRTGDEMGEIRDVVNGGGTREVDDDATIGTEGETTGDDCGIGSIGIDVTVALSRLLHAF